MSLNTKIEVLNRIALVDELLGQRKYNIELLAGKLDLEHAALGKLRDQRQKLDQYVAHLNEIQEMLGTDPADMAPPPNPSSDVPPPSSVGGGEPIAIEVNHAASIAKITDVEASVPSVLPSTEAIAEVSEESLNANTGGENVDDVKSTESRDVAVVKNEADSHIPNKGKKPKKHNKVTVEDRIVLYLKDNPGADLDGVMQAVKCTASYVSRVCRIHGIRMKRRPYRGGVELPPKTDHERRASVDPDSIRGRIISMIECSPDMSVGDIASSLSVRNVYVSQTLHEFGLKAGKGIAVAKRERTALRKRPLVQPRKSTSALFYIASCEDPEMFLQQNILAMKKMNKLSFTDSRQHAWRGSEAQAGGCINYLGEIGVGIEPVEAI
ncbi:hypothetical protein [Maritalea porphyrae]|uniref:hypothetical protein n=1 Tax=Maritalea porphyrae TaxID=880732 RepID=UPI0022AF45FE|nr:hypothetical protein [Maritalea porphyrae]MCZ4270757.1 hypothetical protein [Maritalea porphyrae]